MKIKSKIFNSGKLTINSQLFFIVLSLLLLMNSSCSTRDMWNRSSEYYYKDTIDQYLITKDGEKVIFLGEKYHYIFDDNDNVVKELLNWPNRKELKMDIMSFDLISRNKVKVKIQVIGDFTAESNELSQSELTFLKNLGFKSLFKDGKILIKDIAFTGKRYLPKPNELYKSNSSLNKSYDVQVRVKYNKAKDIGKKIALTPITVVGDVIMISSITLFVGASLTYYCLKPKDRGTCKYLLRFLRI